MKPSQYYGMRRHVLFLAAAAIVFTGAGVLFAQPPHYLRKPVEMNFTAKIKFDESDGRTKKISGPARYKSDFTEPEKVLYDFLGKNRFVYGMDPAFGDIEITKIRKTPSGTVIRFRQTVDGIPVYLSNSSITISKDGTVTWVNMLYRPNGRMKKGTFTNVKKRCIAAEAAEKKALEYLAPSAAVGGIAVPQMMWFESGVIGMVLVWRVVICSNDPHGEFEIFVDALDGTVLQMTDILCGYTGIGNVFDPDPLTTSGQPYGDPYFDDGDNSNTALNNEMSPVILDDITFRNGLFRLEGPNCVIFDKDNNNKGIPVQPSNQFTFNRSNPNFEAVMCYYHIDKSARYLKSLGYWDPGLDGMRTDPHGVDEHNGYFSAEHNWIYLGDVGIDAGEDAGIILHEYGHAIMHNIGPGIPVPDATGEAWCISEGSADYWDATYTAPLNTTDWMWHADWFSAEDNRRTFETGMIYPETYWGFYQGQIWTGALMRIWHAIGKETTDNLFLKTLDDLSIIPTMSGAATACINAEYLINGGRSRAEVLEAFDYYNLVNYIDRIPYTDIDSTYYYYWDMFGFFPRGDEWDLPGDNDGMDNEYFLHLNHAANLNISTCSPVTAFDTKIAVFSSDGDLLLDNDASACGDKAALTEQSLPAGQYYVVVDGNYPSSSDLFGPYELSVTYSRSLEIYTKDNTFNNPSYAQPAFYIRNTGDQSVSDFSVSYYFLTENGKTPVLEDWTPSNCTVSLEELDNGSYRVNYSFNSVTLAPGERLPAFGGFRVGLHYADGSPWDKTDDFSQPDGFAFALSGTVAAFNSADELIYGTVPDVVGSVVRRIENRYPATQGKSPTCLTLNTLQENSPVFCQTPDPEWASQSWVIEPVTGSTDRVRLKCEWSNGTPYYLTVTGTSGAGDGDPVRGQALRPEWPSQIWIVESAGRDGSRRLKSAWSNSTYLTAKTADDMSDIVCQPDHPEWASQEWNFRYVVE